ncbi:MAG: IPT/TIG domain-containing protein [Deltaproteobacteria bacterium]|nr:IPT/TIG domain-containing protein [Deltaproteobacteria bacterium]
MRATTVNKTPLPIAALLCAAFAACSGGGNTARPAIGEPIAITSVRPQSGSATAPTEVTIEGKGFVSGISVTFGTAEALEVRVESGERVRAVAPPHGPGPVDVEVRDHRDGRGARAPSAFRFDDPPVLRWLEPGQVPPAGGAVMLHGEHFDPAARITFGAEAAAGSTLWLSSRELVAVAPAQAPGLVDVAVQNPDGQRSVLPAALRYLDPQPPPPPPPPPPVEPPALTAVSPSSGPEAGGTALTLSGQGFAAGASVTLGGSPATVTGGSATSLQVVAPPHAAGTVDVAVQNPDGQGSSLPGAYRYVAPPPPAPRLAAVAPPSGLETGGNAVTLDGADFAPGATVTFGADPAQVLDLTASRIVAVAPAHAPGAVDVSVRNPDGQSATLAAAYAYQAAPLPPPILSGIAPASGPSAGGTVVSLSGSGFQAGATVIVGGSSAPVTSITSTALTAVAPAHAAGAVDVAVQNPDGQSATLAGAFQYLAPPAIAAVTPGSGPTAGGTGVILTGTGFAAGATVAFGGVPAAVTASSTTSITAVAPAHAAGPVDVAVQNPDGQASVRPAAFTYLPPPRLLAIAPASGPDAGGTSVSLSGTGFSAGATVTFGGLPAAVTAASGFSLTAVAPAHAAGTVDVVVRNADGQSAALPAAYAYLPAPVLADVAPASGPTAGGTALLLTGTGFQQGAAVRIGGSAALVGSVTSTTISATAPAHAAGAVDVAVVNPDGREAVRAGAYLYVAPPPPPTLSGLAPASGSTLGGTAVVLAGADFQAGATVTFDGLPAVVSGLTATAIAAVAPAHAAGAVAVAVQNPDGLSASLAGAFTYVAPPPPSPTLALDVVSPSSGPTAGGTALVLTGTGFEAGAQVSVGGSAAAVGAITATRIEATAPAHAAGPADVVVSLPDGRTASLAAAFAYLAPPPPPSLASLAPVEGPDSGGTAVLLTGSDFQAGATVTFGGIAGAVGTVTSTSISVVTPAQLAGPAEVVVRNPDGQQARLAPGFTFLPPPVLAGLVPASGPDAGGTAIALSGAGFQPGASVTFGGLPAPVVSLGATAIAVTAPAHAAGAVDVTVTNPDGRATTLPAAYAYLAPPPPPPAIAGISPASGPSAGGNAVLLTGSGFQQGATVAFGGAPALVGAVAAGSLSVTAPAHAAGAVDVSVRNPDGQATLLAAGYAYVAPPPALAGLSPAAGPVSGGTAVLLAGSGFQQGLTVTFGGVPALVGAVTDTSASVSAPAHAAGPVTVALRNPDGQSASLPAAFTYRDPPPVLTAATPASGTTAGGTSVLLSGTGFTAGLGVRIGGTPAAVGAVTATTALVTTPAHAAGPADVLLANPDGQTALLAGGFTYVAPPPPPSLASVTPSSGTTAGGTAVTLAGSGFQAGAAVTVGGAAAAVTGLSASAIAITTPAGAAGPADVRVQNPDGQAALLTGGFTFVAPPPPPSLASVAPSSGTTAGGTEVILGGTGFATGAAVTFGGTLATVTAATATALTVTAPAHAQGAVDVAVQNPDGQSSLLAAAFTYAAPPPPPPVLLTISPASGTTAGGTPVTLGGSGFQAGASVTVGGAAATVTSVTATAIGITTPAGAAGPADVAVANPGGASDTMVSGFTYLAPPPPVPAPTLATLSPATGPTGGGTTVLLTGADLDPAVAVTFGGVAATVTSSAAGAVTVVSPAHPAGAVDVTAVNPDGQSATLAGAFTYTAPPAAPPTVNSIAPASGSTFGGDNVVISGRDFANPLVSFGGASATITAASATSLTVLTPPHAAGAVDVRVENGDGQSATVAGGYAYVAPPAGLPAPVLLSVSPASGSVNGNTAVTVTGQNFVTGSTVSFGGAEAFVGAITATTIQVVTNIHAAGVVDVTVVNPDHQASTLAGAYTYVAPPPVVTALNVRGSPQAGGVKVTMAGTGLVNAASVTFGGALATGLTFDALTGTISVFAPASPLGPTADGFVDLVVTAADGQTATVPGFHYGNPPSATGLTPDTGRRGDPLTIFGSDFTADTTGPRAGLQVSFGGTIATITSKTATEIVVAIPKVNPGVYQVFVTNFDGQFVVVPGTFTAPGP